MDTKRYCKPHCVGMYSEPRAVAKELGKLFDAISEIDAYNVSGRILKDLEAFRNTIQAGLENEGYTVSCMNGRMQGTNKHNVYCPGSPTGKKIRKWRKEAAQ